MWAQVDELASNIQEVYQYLIDVRLQAPAELQQESRSLIASLTAVFIVFVAFCGIGFYPNVIRNLNVSIKGNRALLLLLPEDVVASVKVLRETMAALTKKLM
jgi:hypothetical protein